MRERVWVPGWPVNLGSSLSPHRRSSADPAWVATPDGAVWRTSWTADGPATLRVLMRGAEVAGQAWGAGAEWMLESLPAMLGSDDDISGFVPHHDLVRRAAERSPGMRIGRTGRVFEALVPAVLEQKVVGREAWRAWRWLLRRFGEPAPGPAPEGMRVPPPAEVWRQIPSWDWHRSGAEPGHARTIVNAARHAARLERTTRDDADRILQALPGVGVWTSAEIRQRAHGDPDAVSVGDYHLAGLVGWSLTGRKTDDDEMLALLEPYLGHRHRACMLILSAGSRLPARGPRMPARDYRAF